MVAGGVSTRTVKGVFLWLQRLEDGPCFVGGHERRWSAMTDRLRAHRVVDDGALGGGVTGSAGPCSHQPWAGVAPLVCYTPTTGCGLTVGEKQTCEHARSEAPRPLRHIVQLPCMQTTNSSTRHLRQEDSLVHGPTVVCVFR